MSEMAQISLDDRAFRASFQQAVNDMNREGEQVLLDTGRVVVERARELAPKDKRLDPRFPPGELALSIEALPGRTAQGPFVDVGTRKRYALFVEYGTYKDRAQPFLRPALGLAANAIRSASIGTRKQSPRARAFAVRASKRTLIRRALQKRQINATQARQLSRQISSTFRFRARRKRA